MPTPTPETQMGERTHTAEGQFFTVVFRGDVRAFRGNPYTTDTPFGRPHAIGVGNAFTEIDGLEHALSSSEPR